jgi:hypothetical protein
MEAKREIQSKSCNHDIDEGRRCSDLGTRVLLSGLVTNETICCIGLLPGAQAVVPAPDGGYPGGNTQQKAMLPCSTSPAGSGTQPWAAKLRNDTTGGANTTTGFQAVLNNTTGDRNTAYGSESLNRQYRWF